MLKRFRDYLVSIGMTEKAFLSRADEMILRIEQVSPERIVDILVEEVVQEDGTRQYLHLIGFTKNYIGGANNFLTQDRVAVYPMLEVGRLEVTTTNFDLKKATPESRIQAQFVFGAPDLTGSWTLTGSGGNALHIWTLVKKHVQSRL